MERVRIFISSPGDVAEERQRALTVVERLQEEFSGRLSLEPLLWEQEPLLATADFQSQIRSPADFDIFVNILSSRLGSPLGSHFTREDGTPYASGTEFEFEAAVASHRATGRPELLFYRKPPDPSLPGAQIALVDAFLDRWFGDVAAGAAIGDYHSFDDTDAFETLFTEHLRVVLGRFLPRPNNLPAPISSFVGRTTLMAQLKTLVTEGPYRVINLVGQSGIGKSRLALRTARDLLPNFEHGVFLVDVGAEGDETGALTAIASALDRERPGKSSSVDGLAELIGEQSLLLILENLPANGFQGDALDRLVDACPKLHVIVTSLEPTFRPGATTLEVPPLALPDAGAGVSDIRESEAVQLFVDRARSMREDFRLVDANANAILQVCAQLGGLPLAIERAACRMRSMSATRLLAKLPSIKVKDESGQTVYLIPR